MLGRLSNTLLGLFRRKSSEHSAPSVRRGPRTHIIILDGTMSSLDVGAETNAGIAYKLLREANGGTSLYYEAGIQWESWKGTAAVMMGKGINRQIRRAYGYLASRYEPGDRICLLGYSHGAFAVRSLAGIIDRVGLLRRDAATVRNITQVYRHYELAPDSAAANEFARLYCHLEAPIEMIGVWDTVKALGLRLPILWKLDAHRHAFHNHELGQSIRHGFHALAIDETRAVFEPVMWTCPDGHPARVEQVWFRGTHGDIGGQLMGHEASRPLANIPLVWMLERLEAQGVNLPTGWRDRFPSDVTAPSVGSWSGWGKLFLIRKPRIVGRDRSERLHETIAPRSAPGGTSRAA